MTILRRDVELLSQFLRQIINSYPDAPPQLREAIEYSLLAGGKRLRPALVLESWRACEAAEESEQAALSAAAAVELVHTFSLVHDDLPAMDDDELRRGKPTNHLVFGEAMAILAGDAMLTMAFEILTRFSPAATAVTMVRELAGFSGPEGTIGGQALDITSENEQLSLEQIREIHRRKTGALITAACRLGAIAGGSNQAQLDAVTAFGTHLGLAFQITDDVLDVTSTEKQLGKATNKDSRRGKNTYPALIGLDASRAEALKHLDAALGAIGVLGSSATGLITLARFVIARTD